MVNNLKIERLRGIRECALEDFGRFNVFLGHNNCGKTTVLEAIYLFLGNDNIIGNVNINNLRQLIVDSDKKFKLNFYNLEADYPITLSGMYDNEYGSMGGREIASKSLRSVFWGTFGS